MSAMPEEKLRDPRQIYTPSFPSERVKEITAALTPEGGRDFFLQVGEAAERTREEGDLRYLNEVFESWYRTLVFVARPDFEERLQKAKEADGPRLSAQDIRVRAAKQRLSG